MLIQKRSIISVCLLVMFCFLLTGVGKSNLASDTNLVFKVPPSNYDSKSISSGNNISQTLTHSGIPIPPKGSLYHGVHPGGKDGDETDISSLSVYEKAAGKPASWVYFSNEWGKDRAFPQKNAEAIRNAGSIPFIRLMIRSTTKEVDVNGPNSVEKQFTLDHIIRGDFDNDFRVWAKEAVRFGSPLMVEYGTEVNGKWFAWNAAWNDSNGNDNTGTPISKDGAKKFKTAYRHIIQTMKNEGANNISWVFHVNNEDDPDVEWNRMSSYYPGDQYIDLIGVSLYGALTPNEEISEEKKSFFNQFNKVYSKLTTISSDKPIALLEFGSAAGNPFLNQDKWANEALQTIIDKSDNWPRLIGFAWWNEAWPNDDDPKHDTSMHVQDNPLLAAVFQKWLQSDHVLGHIDLDGQTMKPTGMGVLHGRQYPLHTNIIATTFWVGELFNPNAPDGSQVFSTFDDQWMTRYGGCDGVVVNNQCQTERRMASNDFFPTSMTPKMNPFYLDLPFDDLHDEIAFQMRDKVIPWANDPGYAGRTGDKSFSYMKGRWVKLMRNGRTCYGQIEDAGPGQYHDNKYVFGSEDVRPTNKKFNGAGMDVSPALNGCLDFSELNGENDKVDWQFVDDVDVPPGPWKTFATTDKTAFLLDAIRLTPNNKELYKELVLIYQTQKPGSISVFVSGDKIDFKDGNDEVNPIIINGSTLVPIRKISEQLGAQVGWDGNTHTAAIRLSDITIQLVQDSMKASVNGNSVTLEVQAQNIGGHILVPLRFISEQFNKDVDYVPGDQGTAIISIVDKLPPTSNSTKNTGTTSGSKPSAPPLALVYRGPASCDGCSEAAADLINKSIRKFKVEFVGSNESMKINAGTLKDAALYVQPGGGSDVNTALQQMGDAGKVITNYVRNGGRYLGICMGGYLARSHDGFDLLPGESEEYITTSGATVQSDNDTVVQVSWRGNQRYLYFQDGPDLVADTNSVDMDVLGRYSNGKIAALVTQRGTGGLAL